MKKALSVLLTMGLTVSMLAGCGSNGAADNASAGNAADNSAADNTVAATESSAAAGEAKSASDIKVGVIYIGDENEGYTAAHMAASGSSRVPGGSVLPCNRISGSIFRTFQYAQLF